MRRQLVGTAECGGFVVRYYLLEEEVRGGKTAYGISVECGPERTQLHNLTCSMGRVVSLAKLLARCKVTPISVRDVVEDWLLA